MLGSAPSHVGKLNLQKHSKKDNKTEFLVGQKDSLLLQLPHSHRPENIHSFHKLGFECIAETLRCDRDVNIYLLALMTLLLSRWHSTDLSSCDHPGYIILRSPYVVCAFSPEITLVLHSLFWRNWLVMAGYGDSITEDDKVSFNKKLKFFFGFFAFFFIVDFRDFFCLHRSILYPGFFCMLRLGNSTKFSTVSVEVFTSELGRGRSICARFCSDGVSLLHGIFHVFQMFALYWVMMLY